VNVNTIRLIVAFLFKRLYTIKWLIRRVRKTKNDNHEKKIDNKYWKFKIDPKSSRKRNVVNLVETLLNVFSKFNFTDIHFLFFSQLQTQFAKFQVNW